MRAMLPRKNLLTRPFNTGWGKPKREKRNFDRGNVFVNFVNQENFEILGNWYKRFIMTVKLSNIHFSLSNHTVCPCNKTFVFFILSRKLVILFSWWELCFRKRKRWRDPPIVVEANLNEKSGTSMRATFSRTRKLLRSSKTVKSDFGQEQQTYMRTMLPQIWL